MTAYLKLYFLAADLGSAAHRRVMCDPLDAGAWVVTLAAMARIVDLTRAGHERML